MSTQHFNRNPVRRGKRVAPFPFPLKGKARLGDEGCKKAGRIQRPALRFDHPERHKTKLFCCVRIDRIKIPVLCSFVESLNDDAKS